MPNSSTSQGHSETHAPPRLALAAAALVHSDPRAVALARCHLTVVALAVCLPGVAALAANTP